MKDTQTIVVTSAIAAGGLLLYYLWNRKGAKQKWMEVATVEKLYVHPVKACRGVEVDSFTLHEKGVMLNDADIGDRSFMMVYGEGLFATLKIFPKMALIRPTVKGRDRLMLEAPGMEPYEIILPQYGAGKIVSYKVYGAFCQGVDCGDEAAMWLQKFLDADNARLIFHDKRLPHKKREQFMKFGHIGLYSEGPLKSRFQNSSPFNMLSQASIDLLNTKLDSEHQVTDRFFRTNALLKGCGAFAEDQWKQIRIGSCEFVFGKHTQRCPVTTVNPETGIKDPAGSTLVALTSFRLGNAEEKRIYGNSPKFAADYVVIKEGKVHVGDKVLLLVEN